MPADRPEPDQKPDLIVEADSFTEFDDRNILDTLDPTKPLPAPIIPRLIFPEDDEAK